MALPCHRKLLFLAYHGQINHKNISQTTISYDKKALKICGLTNAFDKEPSTFTWSWRSSFALFWRVSKGVDFYRCYSFCPTLTWPFQNIGIHTGMCRERSDSGLEVSFLRVMQVIMAQWLREPTCLQMAVYSANRYRICTE